jgi:type II secretory pathway pseudopilin PulG
MEKLPQAKTSVLAIISLVLSLLFFIPLTGVAALIIGIIALFKISEHKEELKGKGLAIAGTIIGGISTIILLLVIIGFVTGLVLPGIQQARTEALDMQTASNLRQIGLCLYAHAKNNNGALPSYLAELETEGYINDNSILKNAYGHPFNFKQADNNLYDMTRSDILVIDDYLDTSTGYKLRADGSVDVHNPY